MSRHRSPGGRYPHQRPSSPAAASPGAAPRPHSRAAAAPESALRNGMKAAAVTGGALALVMPALTVDIGAAAPPGAEATALRLAAERHSVRVGPVDDGEGARMIPSVVPVIDDQPAPPEATAADLLKAAGLFDLARQREEQRQARAAAADCGAPLGGLGQVKPYVRSAAQFLACLFGEPRLIGVASRANSYSDHPFGLAVDFMVNRATGDGLAACALRNREALGIEYVIWRQRINYGDGWEPMEDRGGITANHYDHVHVSFVRGGGHGKPLSDVCG